MRRVVYLGAHQDYRELDDLMARFNVSTCVIDALPEIHATRAFAQRHDGRVYMNYFNEHQRGSPAWNHQDFIVQENRTEALDLSRSMIRSSSKRSPGTHENSTAPSTVLEIAFGRRRTVACRQRASKSSSCPAFARIRFGAAWRPAVAETECGSQHLI